MGAAKGCHVEFGSHGRIEMGLAAVVELGKSEGSCESRRGSGEVGRGCVSAVEVLHALGNCSCLVSRNEAVVSKVQKSDWQLGRNWA